jgi:hypothetical protein
MDGVKKADLPCTVFPGREWTKFIKLDDITEQELQEKFKSTKPIGEAHMYRFDKKSTTHEIDRVVMYPGKKFPAPYTPFSKPMPVKSNSLSSINAYDKWKQAKERYEQSDPSQYHLNITKLESSDATLVGVFSQLQGTISQMREMGDAVRKTFADIPIDELRKHVQSIPEQIKSLAKKLQQSSGIIIRDENLKLTPAFLQTFKSAAEKKKAEAIQAAEMAAKIEKAKKEAEQENIAAIEKAKVDEASSPNSADSTDSLVYLAGKPYNSVMQLLKTIHKKELTNEEKISRRYTMFS